jgi:hypothetical protein
MTQSVYVRIWVPQMGLLLVLYPKWGIFGTILLCHNQLRFKEMR